MSLAKLDARVYLIAQEQRHTGIDLSEHQEILLHYHWRLGKG